MKKAFTLIVAVLLAALTPLSAAAAELTFDDVGITLSAPDWNVITRDTSPDDEFFAAAGYDGPEFIRYLEDNGVYLNAFSEDLSAELVLVAAESGESAEIFTYSAYSESDLEEIGRELLASLEKSVEGLSPESSGVFSANGVNYVTLRYSRKTEGGEIYTRQYYSVYNGLSVSLTLHSAGDPIDDGELAVQDGAAQSLVFAETLEKPEKSGVNWSVVLRDTLIGALVGAVITVVWSVIARLRQKKKDEKKKAAAENGDAEE